RGGPARQQRGQRHRPGPPLRLEEGVGGRGSEGRLPRPALPGPPVLHGKEQRMTFVFVVTMLTAWVGDVTITRMELLKETDKSFILSAYGRRRVIVGKEELRRRVFRNLEDALACRKAFIEDKVKNLRWAISTCEKMLTKEVKVLDAAVPLMEKTA